MLLNRLCLFLLASALPFVLSFRLFADPLAPKQALWMVAGGLLLARPALPLRIPVPLAGFMALAAAMSLASGAFPGALVPWLVGAACFIRAREEGGKSGFVLRYVRLTAGIATLVALYALSQSAWNSVFSSVKIINPFGERVLGTLGNPTFLADYLAGHLPLALTLAALSRGTGAWAGWSCSALAIAAAVVLSGSKGGQLASAVSLAVWVAVFWRAALSRFRLLAVPITAAAATLALLLLHPPSGQGALSRWTSSSERFSFTQRLGILAGSGRLLARSPVIGNGPGTFPVLFPRYAPPSLARTLGIALTVNHAHNDYAEVACDLGLVGLVLLLFVLFRPVVSPGPPCLRSGLLVSVVALAASMGTNFALFLPSSAFFLWTHSGLASSAGPVSGGKPPRLAAGPAGWLLVLLLGLTAGKELLANALLQLAQGSLNSSGNARAASLLQRAAVLTPLDRHVWQYLGRANELLGRNPEALDAYRTAQKLAPYTPMTSFNVARAARESWLSSRGRDPAALAASYGALRRVLDLDPYLFEARIWGGELALYSSDKGGAREFLVDVPPDTGELPPEMRRLRARLFRLEGRTREAADEEKAAKDMQIRLDVAQAEEALNAGKMDEAESLVRAVLRRAPTTVPAWDILGFITHRQGLLNEALSCYENMAKLAPNSLSAQLNLAIIALSRHDTARAARHVARAAAIAPDSLEVRLARARLLAFSGRTPEAEMEYKAILAKNPRHQLARIELAALLEK